MPARTHGFGVFGKRTKAYCAWLAMRNRCNNPKGQDYPYYGGRGIRVNPRWDDFTVFLADMGEPAPGMTLDRKESNGDYTPENCRWATRLQQSINRSYCRFKPEQLEQLVREYLGGETQKQLAIKHNITQCRVSQLLRQYAKAHTTKRDHPCPRRRRGGLRAILLERLQHP